MEPNQNYNDILSTKVYGFEQCFKSAKIVNGETEIRIDIINTDFGRAVGW